ncbi:hypothetical protein ACMD2_07333, partial [Ananas comosus]
MASRLRSISRPVASFLSHASRNPSRPLLSPTAPLARAPPPPFTRVSPRLGTLQSLLPLHSVVSSARLTSRLGIDSAGSSRSLSQGTLCSSNPG